jgi:hypothetical protein
MYVRQICVLIHPTFIQPLLAAARSICKRVAHQRGWNRKGTSFYKRICCVVPSIEGGKLICFPHPPSKGAGNSMQTSFITASPLGTANHAWRFDGRRQRLSFYGPRNRISFKVFVMMNERFYELNCQLYDSKIWNVVPYSTPLPHGAESLRNCHSRSWSRKLRPDARFLHMLNLVCALFLDLLPSLRIVNKVQNGMDVEIISHSTVKK